MMRTLDSLLLNLIKKLDTSQNSKQKENPILNQELNITLKAMKLMMLVVYQANFHGNTSSILTENKKIAEVVIFLQLWQCFKLDLKSKKTKMSCFQFSILLIAVSIIKGVMVDIPILLKNSPQNMILFRKVAISTREELLGIVNIVILPNLKSFTKLRIIILLVEHMVNHLREISWRSFKRTAQLL